ncbi:MAG: glycosyltransferase family 39 protein [Bacteroidales bacterium]|nr:glycosyltransferase family 39 protein [Bacteroidales bacterium]
MNYRNTKNLFLITSQDFHFRIFLVVGIAINAVALFTGVMDQDSALYASIAKTISQSGDWVNLFSYGDDWLDKPHLPFWITALSFNIFGISAFAYKLPSFLIFLLGVFYLYKLTSLFCHKKVAQMATIIYLISLHVLLANFDVRAEGYLTTFIIAGLYYLCKIHQGNGGYNMILAALFCAAAVMTKGIFVLLTLCGGFLLYWITTKQWKQFIHWRWWLILLLTLLFMAPELYCLYMQFDLHPEKTVFGNQQVSGLKFFFWDSQFGRFFNTGPIKGKGDISFFIHNTLWAFLPWSIALVMGLIAFLKRFKQQVSKKIMILVWSAVCTFSLFSLSKFQLPHYIVILFPHFGIFVAMWLTSLQKEREKQILMWSVWVLITAIIAGIVLLMVYFPFFNTWLATGMILAVLLALTGFRKTEWLNRFFWRNICFSFLCSIFFVSFIYGTILQYNAGMNAAQWINQNCPNEQVIMLDCKNHSMAFYLQENFKTQQQITKADFTDANQSLLLFCPLSSLSKIDSQNLNVEILQEFDYFRITILTAKFISAQTRPSQLKKYVVVRIDLINHS